VGNGSWLGVVGEGSGKILWNSSKEEIVQRTPLGNSASLIVKAAATILTVALTGRAVISGRTRSAKWYVSLHPSHRSPNRSRSSIGAKRPGRQPLRCCSIEVAEARHQIERDVKLGLYARAWFPEFGSDLEEMSGVSTVTVRAIPGLKPNVSSPSRTDFAAGIPGMVKLTRESSRIKTPRAVNRRGPGEAGSRRYPSYSR